APGPWRGQLAVDPDLSVVVDVRPEKDPVTGQGYAAQLLRQLDGDAPPAEREPLGQALPNVLADLPPGVVVFGQAGRAPLDAGRKPFIRLAGHVAGSHPPLSADLTLVLFLVQVERDSWHLFLFLRVLRSWSRLPSTWPFGRSLALRASSPPHGP